MTDVRRSYPTTYELLPTKEKRGEDDGPEEQRRQNEERRTERCQIETMQKQASNHKTNKQQRALNSETEVAMKSSSRR
jgi:hypothetical protein